MMPKKTKSEKRLDAAELRRQAEEKLGQQKQTPPSATKADTQRLVHELQVHQIELEMQNEELVQSREALEALLRQYTDLYDFAPVGYFTLASDGAIHQVNLAGAKLLGVDRSELIMRRFGLFVSQKFRLAFSSFLENIYASRENVSCDILLQNDGWVHMQATCDDGQECRAALTDITERKRTEEALRDSETRFRSVLNNSRAVIYRLNVQSGQYDYISPSVEKVMGFSAEELKAQDVPTALAMIHPEDLPAVLEAHAHLDVSGESDVEYRQRARNGEYRWFSNHLALVRDSNGLPLYRSGNLSDITDRKQAEEDRARLLMEVEKRAAELEATISSIAIGLIIYNQAGKAVRMNDTAKALLPEEVFIKKTVEERAAVIRWETEAGEQFPTEEIPVARALRGETTHNVVLAAAFPDHKLWISASAAPIQTPGGRRMGVVATFIDITERKQGEEKLKEYSVQLEQMVVERTRDLKEAQKQLVRKEKLAVLGQLAGGVGHELRNPLGVISSSVYYLNLVQPDANEKIKKHHAMIEQEVHNATRIIGDLLDYARVINTDPKPASVRELVEHTLSRFPVPTSVRVSIKIPADLPLVYADPLHVEQILGNLITNGCQAMSTPSLNTKAGSATLSGGGKLTITARMQKQMLAIAVKDTGTGVTPANMEKLFEPLFSTKVTGIGLGLAVSKKLAEANGGRIEVESEVGKGSTFTLYLPLKAEK